MNTITAQDVKNYFGKKPEGPKGTADLMRIAQLQALMRGEGISPDMGVMNLMQPVQKVK